MISSVDYIRILPELVLTMFASIVMLADPLLRPKSNRKSMGVVALMGTLAAIVAAVYQARPEFLGSGWFGMVRIDAFSIFFHVLAPAISALVILASFPYLEAQEIRSGEYYALILLGTAGMVLMSSAVELVLVFIALEISSISTYILAGFRKRLATSAEASLKYFLLGSFATAFFLYGVALIFGATGSTNVYTIATTMHAAHATGLAYLAVAMMFVGIGFKVASAPFHIWTPDVYEGAPAPIVGLMSTGPKAAAFAVLLRVLFGASAPGWFWLVWLSAVLSMTLGNLGALMQNNVKRLLAYSSIAHAGYLLVAFAAAQQMGIAAAIFYTAAYAAMNVGAFIVVSHFARAGERYVTLDDYSGLGFRAPVLAATLSIFLLSLIGIPLTGGFFAKFYVFSAALKSNLLWLTVIGVINSAVAAYYYLRVIVVMYMREPSAGSETGSLPVPLAVTIALLISVTATFYLGIAPGKVLDYATRGAADLLQKNPPAEVTSASRLR